MAAYFGYFGLSTERAKARQLPTEVAKDGRSEKGENTVVRTDDCGCIAPVVENVDGVLVMIHGSAQTMGPDSGTFDESSPTQIARLYQAHGRDFISRLRGTFALALIDTRNRTVYLAVDRMGIGRLCYACDDDSAYFSDSAESVARFATENSAIREQAFFDYIFFDMIPAPETIFERVRKVPAGCIVEIENGNTAIEHYWRPDYDFSTVSGFPGLRDELLQVLETSVRDTAPGDSTGAFLSGGLDSSTVTGMLCRVQAAPTRTFSIGFGHKDYDELTFARIANDHFGSQGNYYDVTPDDIVSSVPLIATAYDEPFGNSSAVPTYFCARLAVENGVTHLLAGDGGDELFGGNERYARQKLFDVYRRLPRWFRDRVLSNGMERVAADSKIMPLRKLKSYVEQAQIPLPDRFESWNFVYREGAAKLFSNDYLESIDSQAPLELMREVWRSATADDLLDRMLCYDWRFTLADNDLRKVGSMCQLAGVEVSYPMLNDRVVEFSCRVPPRLKLKRLQLRHFYRKSMRGFLPDDVLHKNKHGFGLPFGVWLKTHRQLKELVSDNLAGFRKRGIVSPTFIDGLLARHQQGHASYYGYIIWNLMMLEEWLQKHRRP